MKPYKLPRLKGNKNNFETKLLILEFYLLNGLKSFKTDGESVNLNSIIIIFNTIDIFSVVF